MKKDKRQVCEWYLFCTAPAVALEPHPIGDIPICADCLARLRRLEAKVAKRPAVGS